jgi:peroxiredoxin
MLTTSIPAPDFTLPDAHGNPVTLSDYRGAPVVLVFYPKDRSPVCSLQLAEYARHAEEFEHMGAKILAVSTDSVSSHTRWQSECGFPFPLLADGDGEVCRLYDVRNFLGQAQRVVYIIDGNGMILHALKQLPITYQDAADLLRRLEQL